MRQQQHRIEVHNVDLARMQQIATALVQRLPAPLAIGLVGTLGAGKTKLAQLIVAAASTEPTEVTSPTFTLVQSYHCSPRIHHLDAYRVSDEDEFLELGVEEMFDDDAAWTIVEWADRMRQVMPPETLWIELVVESDENFRTMIATCARAQTISVISSAVNGS